MGQLQALRGLAILIVGAALGATTGGCATARESSGQTVALESLHTSMQWVRGGRTSEPRVLAELPSVDALVGVRRAQLMAQLGQPRTCLTAFEPPCRRQGEILWTFYRGHSADDADGPVLVVEFDRAGLVTGARWRRPEVQAPAPIAPTAGGEAETEISSAE